MPLTLTEAVSDLPALLGLVQAVEAAVSALPAKADAKPSDYMKLAATVLNAAAPLADSVADQLKS